VTWLCLVDGAVVTATALHKLAKASFESERRRGAEI